MKLAGLVGYDVKTNPLHYSFILQVNAFREILTFPFALCYSPAQMPPAK